MGAEASGLDRVLEGDPAALAVAVPGPTGVALVGAAVEAGIPAASCADDAASIRGLLELGPSAFDRSVTVIAGCGLVPGIADVLARHGADALTAPDEVHVARVGVAGPHCRAALRAEVGGQVREWRDGAWHRPDRHGPQLVWFPEPVAARECVVVDGGIELLRLAVPEARTITVRAEEPPRQPRSTGVRRSRPEDEFGGARVEVWGWRGDLRCSIVYGAIERPAVAAGTVLAVSAARLAGLVPAIGLRAEHGGVRSVGEAFGARTFLAELAHRGVKAAAFEGARA